MTLSLHCQLFVYYVVASVMRKHFFIFINFSENLEKGYFRYYIHIVIYVTSTNVQPGVILLHLFKIRKKTHTVYIKENVKKIS